MSSCANSTDYYAKPDLEEQKSKSWRYIGYKGFCEWSATTDDFLVIRRFDSLAIRAIFLLQWEITKLESELAKMDETSMYGPVPDDSNGSFERDFPNRQRQIRTIKEKLEEYCEFSNHVLQIYILAK